MTDSCVSAPVIRTAKKVHRCVNARAHAAGNAPNCHVVIQRDDRYEQGDCDPYAAGGFGHEYICAGCSDAVKSEVGKTVGGCHVCGQQHGTNHYFKTCLPRHKAALNQAGAA